MEEVIVKILLVAFLFFVLLLAVFFMWNMTVALQSKYWITQYDEMMYTDNYKEDSGCVVFYDNWFEKEAKVCGEYTIRETK